MAESPRWLVKRGRIDEAHGVLLRLSDERDDDGQSGSLRFRRLSMRRDEENDEVPDSSGLESRVKAELDTIVEEFRMESTNEAFKITWGQFVFGTDRMARARRRMLLIIIVVAMAQQLTGIEALMYYTPEMLEEIGFDDRTEALGISFAMGVLKTIVVFVASAILDRPRGGRRPLLLFGFGGLVVANSLMSIGFGAGGVAGLNISGLFFFVVFFSIGPGPIAWLLCSEILPTEYRAKGMVLACMMNRFCSFVVSMIFLTASDGLSPSHLFGFFATISIVAVVFVYVYVPETKGRSLEKMGEYFLTITTRRNRIVVSHEKSPESTEGLVLSHSKAVKIELTPAAAPEAKSIVGNAPSTRAGD